MDYHKLDDGKLMQLVAISDDQALGVLYDRYGRLVYSLSLTTVGEESLAEEITQDVFMRIWQKAETYRPSLGKITTWIASITRYRSIDMLRRKRIRPEGNRVSWSLSDEIDLPDPDSLEEQVEYKHRQSRIRAGVNQLPDEQRQVLAYAFFYGYSHSQIAELLDEPLGTVKTRIRLAMQKLRQYLSGDELS